MWHRLPLDQKRRPAGYVTPADAAVPQQEWIRVPAGRATLGRDMESLEFGWDNERPAASADVKDFEIERHNVTNAAFLEFVDAGGYQDSRWWRPDDWSWIQGEGIGHPLFWERHDDAWHWRGMFELVSLPLSWPVFVSQAEARAKSASRAGSIPGCPSPRFTNVLKLKAGKWPS